ncbi:hypothetical protein [uncultured Jatrophihabitans sp.]|uniref:hypothetical protein n=1 Tax=uncultured Jatrophihabitans sp. TaxID=1610747 RepID=UPI0035CB8450
MKTIRVEGGDTLVRHHQDDAIELCQRHGLNADDVAWAELDLIDVPLLRFGVSLRDDTGHCFLDDNHRIAEVTVERRLIGELPTWWPQ